jgi:hypothetical protein
VTTLKACPKCRTTFGQLGYERCADVPFFGRCRACGFTAPAGLTRAEAVANWEVATAAQNQEGVLTIPLY